jgi:hypothetical protein
MKKLFFILLIALFSLSCENNVLEIKPDNEIVLEAAFERFDMRPADSNQEEVKAVFTRSLIIANKNWKMIINGDTVQEIYLTPTLDVYNPFFITLYTSATDCFHVIDFIPQDYDVTLISQNENAMILQSVTNVPGEYTLWIFFLNADDNLEWQIQTFDAGGTYVENSMWSMYFEPTTVDLATLNYCPGESYNP